MADVVGVIFFYKRPVIVIKKNGWDRLDSAILVEPDRGGIHNIFWSTDLGRLNNQIMEFKKTMMVTLSMMMSGTHSLAASPGLSTTYPRLD